MILDSGLNDRPKSAIPNPMSVTLGLKEETCVKAPILILDSGLGGLTVARAIRHLMPAEDLIYFGDTARVPYGLKSQQTVTSFVRQIIAYALPMAPKHVVIACNTATALAMSAMKRDFPRLAISGVIEPGARAAVEACGAKHFPVIGVLATEATIRSGAYERAIVRRRSQSRMLLQPAPLLVPIVEDGRSEEDPLVRLALKQYLRPLVKRGMDVLVLGCTHYPIYKSLIQRMLGESIAVIDSADRCAQDVRRRLKMRGLLREPAAQPGGIRCFVTDDSPRFESVASRFMGERLDPPVRVAPERLYELEQQYSRETGFQPVVADDQAAGSLSHAAIGADNADLADFSGGGDDDGGGRGLPLAGDDTGEAGDAGEFAGEALAAGQGV
jgi:glutamate racemase